MNKALLDQNDKIKGDLETMFSKLQIQNEKAKERQEFTQETIVEFDEQNKQLLEDSLEIMQKHFTTLTEKLQKV